MWCKSNCFFSAICSTDVRLCVSQIAHMQIKQLVILNAVEGSRRFYLYLISTIAEKSTEVSNEILL